MPINPEVMRQVNYDAGVGGRNMPKNGFQRAQDFLRNKIFGKPTNPAGMTSQQQTAFDAKQGGKAMKDFARTKIKPHADVKAVQNNVGKAVGVVTGLVSNPAGIATALSQIPSGQDQSMKWKRLGYPSKESYDAVVSGKMTGQQVLDGQSPDTATNFTDKRTGSVEKPSAYPTEAVLTTIKPSRDYQKEASIDLPTDDRNDTRIDGKGNIQTGTNTSPKPMTMDDANKLLSGGYKIENPYSSNQLPTTASSPYTGKSNSQTYNPETLHQHDSDVDNVSLSKDIYGDQSGIASMTRGRDDVMTAIEQGANSGKKVPEEKVNWANRTMADNSDEKVRRRAAFLDGDVGIMQAMRNQEAIQGRVYAGGKHYQRNKNAGQEGQNDFVEISADQSRDRSYYRQTADEVFANHLGKAKDTVASGDIPDLPKDAPTPVPGAVPGNSTIDKSQLDTSDLMDMNPSESIIGNNTPSRTVKKGTLFNR